MKGKVASKVVDYAVEAEKQKLKKKQNLNLNRNHRKIPNLKCHRNPSQ